MDKVNWKDLGHVTKVKSQSRLRICYAYATVATIESFHSIKGHGLIEFSEQQLIDCVKSCDSVFGGNIRATYTYAMKKGLCKSEDYPSLGWKGKCKCGTVKPYLKISNFKIISSEEELESIVNQYPVTVSLDATLGNFKDFKGDGIFRHSEHDNYKYQRNHAVCVYGYGTDPDGTSYWLIKNSWGEDWGDGGCAKIEKGKNTLGIGLYGKYPIDIEVLTDMNISELEDDDEEELPDVEVMRDALRQNYFSNPQMSVEYKSGESSHYFWRG